MPRHHARPPSLLLTSLLAFAAGAATATCLIRREARVRLPEGCGPTPARGMAAISARAAGEASDDGAQFVRPAGPGAMRDPPRRWDLQDEVEDESFPASDPPGNY